MGSQFDDPYLGLLMGANMGVAYQKLWLFSRLGLSLRREVKERELAAQERNGLLRLPGVTGCGDEPRI